MSAVQGDISVSIGLSEEDLQRGIGRVGQALNGLAKTVEQVGAMIDQIMKKAAAETDKAAGATRQLGEEEKKTADATRKLTDEQKQATEATKKATAEKRRLADEQKKAAEAARHHKQSLSDLREGLTQVSAAAALVTAALVAVAKVSIDAFNQQERSFLGLEAIAGSLGHSLTDANKAANDLSADGLMQLSDASTGLKNLLASKFDLPQAIELMRAFKDAAAFGRQGSLTFGEAVRTATEGVKNGNSILVDNAGITKNLSVILKEAGHSENDLMNVQSDLNVRMALYNGILKEAALFQGNAATAAETLAGSQSRAGVEAFKAKAAFGEALAPVVQLLADAMGTLLGSLTKLIETNPELARTIFLIVGGVTAAITAVGGLTVAWLALNAAFLGTPIGMAILRFASLAGALAGIALSAKASAEEQERNERSTAQLGTEYERLNRILGSTTATAAEKTKAQEDLKRVIAELGDLMPDLVTKWGSEGHAIELNTEKVNANTEAVRANIREKAQSNLDEAARAEGMARDNLARLEGGVTGDIEFAISLLNNPTEEQKRLAEGRVRAANAKQIADARKVLAVAEAETNRLAAQAAGPDERGRGSFTRDPVPKTPTTLDVTAGGKKVDRFAEEMSDTSYLLAREKISIEEAIHLYERARDVYATTTKERQEADLRVHQLNKQLTADREKQDKDKEAADEKRAADDEKRRKDGLTADLAMMDHKVKMNRISTAEEIKEINRITEAHKLNDEEKRSMEVRLANAQQRLADEKTTEIVGPQREAEQLNEERVRGTIDNINHEQRMRRLSKQQEIDDLETHLATEKDYYIRHVDERKAIEERLVALKENLRQADLAEDLAVMDHKVERNQISAEDEIKEINRIMAAYELSTEERRNMETRLANAQQRLADETSTRIVGVQTKAEQVNEERVRGAISRINHEQRIGELSKRQEIDSLEKHLATEKDYYIRHAADRETIEERVFALKDSLQKQADDEKIKTDKENASQALTWIQILQKAELDRLRTTQQAAEEAQQSRIKGLQDQLSALERIWATEDRRNQLTDLKGQLADVKADTRFEKVMSDGTTVFTFDEAKAADLEKQIAESERDETRQQQREALQDRIEAAQDEMTAMRDRHQTALQARQDFWTGIQGLDLSKFTELSTAAGLGLDDFAKVFRSKLAPLQTEVEGYMQGIEDALKILTDPTILLPAAPTMPASLAASTGAASGPVIIHNSVVVNGATDPQATAAAVKIASQDGARDGTMEALVRSGRTSLQTLPQ